MFFLREDFGASQVDLLTDLDYQGPVRMDPERMRRVLVNIAGNAVDAMQGGGTFTITTRLSPNPPNEGMWEAF